jgi:hypothetical protein
MFWRPLFVADRTGPRIDAVRSRSRGVTKALTDGRHEQSATGALLRDGTGYMATMTAGLGRWMEERETAARANYARILERNMDA